MTHVKRISKHDNFYTPKWVIDLLLDHIDIKNKIVWECASGIGNITNEIKPHCKKVFETDINEGQDFLTYEPCFDFNCIITNPPFSLKTEFIEKCIHHNKPFYLLLPLTTLEGIKRQKIIKKANYDLTILLPNQRVQYAKNKQGSPFASAWFCFERKKFDVSQFIEVRLINSNKYK